MTLGQATISFLNMIGKSESIQEQIDKIFFQTKMLGPERCLSGEEHILLLQRTQVLFPAPMSASSPPVTPAPGFLIYPAALGTCIHTHMSLASDTYN